jgi:hypothetical protein
MPNPLQEEPSNIQQDIHQSGDRGVVIGQSSGSIHIGDVYYIDAPSQVLG